MVDEHLESTGKKKKSTYTSLPWENIFKNEGEMQAFSDIHKLKIFSSNSLKEMLKESFKQKESETRGKPGSTQRNGENRNRRYE